MRKRMDSQLYREECIYNCLAPRKKFNHRRQYYILIVNLNFFPWELLEDLGAIRGVGAIRGGY